MLPLLFSPLAWFQPGLLEPLALPHHLQEQGLRHRVHQARHPPEPLAPLALGLEEAELVLLSCCNRQGLE
ncbi:MAG: hypothetical protein HYY45_02425 [Deltaproteobacteria bacterium]|nr:hypothetical protein [Deltaproteobacteria bacterium]